MEIAKPIKMNQVLFYDMPSRAKYRKRGNPSSINVFFTQSTRPKILMRVTTHYLT